MRYPAIYSYLAKAIDYPAADFRQLVIDCGSALSAHFPEAAARYQPFREFVAGAEEARLEEAYTATFDVNAVCHLDVGYQLFGEDYKRGALLVELSRVQREAGNDTGTELADYLPNLLRAVPKVTRTEEREELVRKLMLPAIEKMVASFPEGSANVYRQALETIAGVLEQDFGSAVPFPVHVDYSAEIAEGGTYV